MGLKTRAGNLLALGSIVGVLASTRAAAAVDDSKPAAIVEPASDACPHLWSFERGGTSEFYALVFRAKTPMTVDAKLRIFLGSKSYTRLLPAVAIAKTTETTTVPFRSAPIVVRSPDTTVEPSIIVSFAGDSASCPSESRDLVHSTRVRYRPGPAFEHLESDILNEADNSGVHELTEDSIPDMPACSRPFSDASAPRPVSPEYPEIAKQSGVTGTSIAIVTIDAHGAMRGVETYASSDSPSLDQATLAAAKKTSYVAQISACIPTSGTYIFRATFTAG